MLTSDLHSPTFAGFRHLRWLVLVLVWTVSLPSAAQYKSRLFQQAKQTLSQSEKQTLAALSAKFESYTDPYQVASTGQFLARQMAADKNYEKAAEYYDKTLKTDRLDKLLVTQLRREYAQVLLQLGRAAQVPDVLATNAQQPLQADVPDRVLLARAYIAEKQFHRAIEWLHPLLNELSGLSEQRLKQLAGLWFQAQSPELAIRALQALLARRPDDVALSRQLTGLYLQQQAYKQALDLWSLTFNKGLLSQESDWLLLADLYRRDGSPDKAARLVNQGFDTQQVAPTAPHYYKLFEFWYQAKELEKARQALWQSVQISRHLEHGLILAELRQQAEQWQALLELVNLSCETVLPDHLVGRYNLMLGIALHKLQNHREARRALINATLISGVKVQAREWLSYIGATPATIEESRELWGPCLPEDPRIKLPENLQAKTASQTPSTMPITIGAGKRLAKTEVRAEDHAVNSPVADSPPLTVVNLPRQRFYSTRFGMPVNELADNISKKIFNLIKSLMRAGGRVDGKLHLFIDDLALREQASITLGLPFSSAPKRNPGYQIVKRPETQALSLHWQGPPAKLAEQWQQLVVLARQAGHKPTGEARMVFVSDNSATGQLDVQLLLILQTP